MTAHIAVDQLPRGRRREPDGEDRAPSHVVPVPGASMRVLEVLVSCAALGIAILLGLAR